MLKMNVGFVDRVVRVIVGLALLSLFFIYPGAAWRYGLLVGLVPLLTGLFGTCPSTHCSGSRPARQERPELT